jgi:hypothetical protein
MPNEALLTCRVCGLRQESPPWGEDGRTPNFEICACCGVEFGYEDAQAASVRRYRNAWLGRGTPWFRPADRPAGWMLEPQLQNVPEEFR